MSASPAIARAPRSPRVTTITSCPAAEPSARAPATSSPTATGRPSSIASSTSLQTSTSVKRWSEGGTGCAGAAFSTVRTPASLDSLNASSMLARGASSGATTTLATSIAPRGSSRRIAELIAEVALTGGVPREPVEAAV